MESDKKSFLVFFVTIIGILFLGLVLYYTFFYTEKNDNILPSPTPTSTVATGKETDKYTIDLSTETTTSDSIEFDKDLITIKDSGTYTVLGSYKGKVIVDAKDGKVILKLSNVTIESSNSSSIICKKASRCTIELVDGTKNTLKSQSEEENAAVILATSPIFFKGTGKLEISGKSPIGINVNNSSLSIEDGIYEILEKKIGIYGDKSTIFLSGGKSTIISNEESIYSSKQLEVVGGNHYLESKEKMTITALEGYRIIGGTLVSVGVEKVNEEKESSLKKVEYSIPERAVASWFSIVNSENMPVYSFIPSIKTREILVISEELNDGNYAVYNSNPLTEVKEKGIYFGNVELKDKI